MRLEVLRSILKIPAKSELPQIIHPEASALYTPHLNTASRLDMARSSVITPVSYRHFLSLFQFAQTYGIVCVFGIPEPHTHYSTFCGGFSPL